MEATRSFVLTLEKVALPSQPDQIIESVILDPLDKPVRLSDLRGVFKTISSRKGLKKAVDKGLVLLNGEPARTGDWVHGGETLSLLGERINRPVLELSFEVLFEDDHLAVVNKPAGILVSGNKHRTLENALPFNLKPSGQIDALEWPQAIHRLDFPTSGVLLVGKTRTSVTDLNRQFEDQSVQKEYMAITVGEMPERGIVEIPINGKSAHTIFECVRSVKSEKYQTLNLVKLMPTTGRRNQLRIHLAALGSPILEDGIYGLNSGAHGGNRLFLHASGIAFLHPITREQSRHHCDIPPKFKNLSLNI